MLKRIGLVILSAMLFGAMGCAKKEEPAADSGTPEVTKEAGASDAVKDSLVGTFKLILDTSEVPESEKAMMEDMAKDRPEISMVFKADGTADLRAKVDNSTARWEVYGESVTVTPDEKDEKSGTFKIADGGKTLVPDPSQGLEPIGKAVYVFKKQ